VERPADERTIRSRSEGVNADTKLSDVLPLIESNLTIQEVAERLGISVEPACALVRAALRSRRDGAQ
jgi:threonine synthase